MNESKYKQSMAKIASAIEFFTNSLQYKKANIVNFILAVPLEMNYTNEIHNVAM